MLLVLEVAVSTLWASCSDADIDGKEQKVREVGSLPRRRGRLATHSYLRVIVV